MDGLLVEDAAVCLFSDRVPAARCQLVRLDPRSIAIFRRFPLETPRILESSKSD